MTVDGVPIDVDTRKAIALVAYLTVAGGATRDTLANLFWGDTPTDRARATLRRTLSSLRTGIGSERITSDRNRVSLNDRLAGDVTSFEMELRATSEHGHDSIDVCSLCIPHLARATELYRGDFLEGFTVRDAPDFEDWARATREHLRMRAGDAFHRLSMARAVTGDYAGAIAAVSRWIDLDPMHEPAHRSSMLLHAWSGDRPGAIEAYRRCVAVLDEDLGVSPLEETTELYGAILDEDLPPAPGARRRVRHTPPTTIKDGPHKLIGRDTQLELLRRAVEMAHDKGQVVVLEGASWMGKTRLLEEFVVEAAGAGHAIAVARSFRSEQSLPFGVVTQLTQHLLKLVRERGKHVPDWVMQEAGRLDPRLAAGGGPAVSDPLGELRLMEALYEIVRTPVEESVPLVVGIDDTQWLDNASVGFISYLSRRIEDLRLVLILLRQTGEAIAPALEDMFASAEWRIDLGPLGPDEIVAMAGDPERAESIVAATGGIPLLVAEALDGRSSGEENASIGRYVEERLRAVPDLGRQILTAASVLGGSCDGLLLRQTSGRTEEEVVQAVEGLVSGGLMRELGDGDGIGFTLDALQETVYESASLVRRRLLHRRAADALESRPRASADLRLAGEIAAHLRAAGDPEAAGWYRRAGDLATRVYANREAKVFYETAIALGAEDIAGLHLALGELAMADADYTGALRELGAAAAHADGPLLGLAEHRLGEVQRLLGKFSLAEEHFERSEPNHPVPASLYADWALLHHRLGNTNQAVTMAHRAQEMAESNAGSRELSRALNILGVVSNDAAAAMGHIDRALDLAGDDDLARMAALNNKAHLLDRIGNSDAAHRLVEEAIGIAAKTGHRHRQAALHNHLADLAHRAGRPRDAEQALTTAVSMFADIDTGSWEPEVWLLRQW